MGWTLPPEKEGALWWVVAGVAGLRLKPFPACRRESTKQVQLRLERGAEEPRPSFDFAVTESRNLEALSPLERIQR